MKIITLFGTRPEIIRLSQVIKQLDRFCDQTLVHTGQNYDPNLSDIFFQELDLRPPNIHMGIRESEFAEQAGQILASSGRVFSEHPPDRLLILGDTNSGLAAIVAARLGIPVYHMEAGNRCFDDRVPEEINRRIIDHCSAVLMPYTHRSKENLLREGIERDRIFVIGNPIYEVLNTFAPKIEASDVMARLQAKPKSYFLATLHRSENVNDHNRLAGWVAGLSRVADLYRDPMYIIMHPHTASKLKQFGLNRSSSGVHWLDPMGFFDFVKLEKNARLVLSDSGTVQEECAIFGVPNVTIRDVTERPETLECGSNVLSGAKEEDLLRVVSMALSLPPQWTPPVEYVTPNVARTVTKIVLGYTSLRRHYTIL